MQSKRRYPRQGLGLPNFIHDVNQLHNIEGSLERENVTREGVRYLLESGLMGKRYQAVALTKKLLLKFIGRKIN